MFLKKYVLSKLVFLSVFLGTGLALYFRLYLGGKQLFRESLWAEDGLFALCNIKASSYGCAFDSFSGYWSALPRFNAFIVSRFHVSDWALVNNALTLAFLAFLSTYSYSVIQAQFNNKLIPLFLVAAPTLNAGLSREVLMVSNSIYGILGYYILVIYLYSNFEKMHLNSKFWIFLLIAFIFTLSNPLGLLMLCLCLIDVFIFRNKSQNSFILIFIIVLGNIVQGIYIFSNYAERHFPNNGLVIFKTLVIETIRSFTLIVYSPLRNNYLSERNIQNILLLIFLSLILLFFVALYLRKLIGGAIASTSNRNVLLVLFILVATLVISVFTNGAAARYEVMTSLYASLFLFSLIQLQTEKVRLVAYPFLMFCIGINGILNFGASDLRATGPLWSQQLHSAKQFCSTHPGGSVRIEFAPYWIASVSHPYEIHEPTTEKLSCFQLTASR